MRSNTTLAAAALIIGMTGASFAAPGNDAPLYEFPYAPSLDVTSLDTSANPCEDLYQYSCGGWIKNNPIPEDQSSWSVYGKLFQDNQRFLWGILDVLAKTTDTRNASQQKIGDYFAACMNEAAIEKKGMQSIQPFLNEINTLQSRSALPALLGSLSLKASGAFYFDAGSSQDFSDSAQIIAVVSAGGLGLPERDYYLKKDKKSLELRRQYLQHIASTLQLGGDAASKANAQARRIMAIETVLAKATLTNVEQRDPYKVFHRMDASAVQKLTPDFAWSAYWKAMGREQPAIVNVTEPAFFKKMSRLLARAPLDDLKSYLRWHVISGSSPLLSKAFVDANFAFYGNTLAGTPKLTPRWQRCVTQVDQQLGDALGQEFVARTFGPKIKDDTLRMTTQIEDAMQQEINHLDWMSDATKQRAIEKLHGIANKVGYPDHWRDYSAIDIQPDDFYGNTMRARMFEVNRQFEKIGKPVDHGEWDMTPPTVNAYYNPMMNDINFPAGVLQPPLYDAKLDDAPNYGNTGGTIGHELTHAFDDQGRQFDAKGNLKDWWNDKDATKFKNRAQCIVTQYGKYKVIDELYIKSELTQGEDIADLGGLILAWIAWKTETQGKELASVDGLTPDQRFFVGAAQWACSSTRPETARLHALTDPHSPAKYRINGMVVNMPQFEQAFHCKKGQAMVAEERCRIW